MSKPITGGCVCGAIRYEVKARPLAMFKCHCRTCQMLSGGAYTPVIVISAKSFQLKRGQIKYCFTERITGGARHQRGFCGDCGSRLTGAETEGQDSRILGITAASLDDPSIFIPQSDIFTSHAQPWDLMDPHSPKYPEYPPR